jgi:GT2 family glycosyltransferase
MASGSDPSASHERTSVEIAVVLVNWNGGSDTVDCLDSIRFATTHPSQVVVVDNASTDDSLYLISSWIESNSHGIDVRVIRSDRNRGFSGGNNLALSELHSEGRATHYLLLNNDTRVEAEFFASLERGLRMRPDAGLTTATIMEAANPGKVWYAGGYFQAWRALAHHRREIPAGNEPVDTEFITGCVLIISRTAYETLGPLPECYFPAYLEDTEYSYRAGIAGFERIYIPDAIVHHKIGASTAGGPAANVVRWTIRHRGYFVRRNLSGVERLIATGYMLATKPVRALLLLLSGHPALAVANITGMIEGLFSSAVEEQSESSRRSIAALRRAALSAPTPLPGEHR